MTALPTNKVGEVGATSAVIMAAIILTSAHSHAHAHAVATGILTLGGYWMTFVFKQNEVIRADVNCIRSEASSIPAHSDGSTRRRTTRSRACSTPPGRCAPT